MHDDRIGRLVRRLCTGKRTALDALAGIGDRVLIGDLGLRETLHGDTEAGLVHHHEHALHALVLFADQPAGGAVVVHHARRIAVDAHLVLDRTAHHAVALPWRAIRIHK